MLATAQAREAVRRRLLGRVLRGAAAKATVLRKVAAEAPAEEAAEAAWRQTCEVEPKEVERRQPESHPKARRQLV